MAGGHGQEGFLACSAQSRRQEGSDLAQGSDASREKEKPVLGRRGGGGGAAPEPPNKRAHGALAMSDAPQE